MQGLLVTLVLALVMAALVGPVLAIVAFVRSSRLQGAVRDLQTELGALRRRVETSTRLAAAERSLSADATTVSAAVPLPPPAPARTSPPPVGASPSPVSVPAAGASSPMPPTADEPRRAASVALPVDPAAPRVPPRVPPPSPPGGTPRPPTPDFATTLGPKILVATGALAIVVFLGLFVKYAWDNDWIGPTGRVLSGAILGLGLLAAGARMMRGEYRPLGQGLAAAGLAGLYSSAFAAHAFYHLIGRGAAGALMAIITINAVLLAARLDARLLAALAWVGGYLTPLLLSTGEDKAIALFLFLLLLDLGALFLDHRKPWPETVPLAMVGTLLLYGGWYAEFFTPKNFGVAAFGIVLFTAVFALGMARKERPFALAVVYVLGALGLAILAGGADRPETLVVLSLALGGAAVRSAMDLDRRLALVAALAVSLPFLAWSAAFYRPEAFGIAAAWLVGATLLLMVPSAGEADAGAGLFPAAVLLASGAASIGLCAATDKPPALLAFLLAEAAIALVARTRFAWAGLIGVASSAVSVLVWMDRYYAVSRARDAYLLAVPVAGVYLLALLLRGLVLRRRLQVSDVLTHLASALFVWTVLFRVLYEGQPRLLGLLSMALAAVYLAAGLAAVRQRPVDRLQARALLGLAASFLTVAIPVQLGLHGITLAWAVEGVLLVALGATFESSLTRAGGYAVLALTVLRLFARHLPLHPAGFDPLFNPAFGTWLFVVAALGAALWRTRRLRSAPGTLDHAMGPVLAGTALVLLFGLLTVETRDTFAQQARRAAEGGDLASVEHAHRVGGLAISVLWTVFATALLGAGLFARNRPLFYSSYGVFALTAGKVVFWDLGRFSIPYRMLAFLALGLLLMAGAYLNLRFRERLAPRGLE